MASGHFLIVGDVSVTRIAIITNVLPSYRKAFYEKLFEHFGDSITIFCQRNIVGTNLATAHQSFTKQVRLIRCASLPRENLSWQFLPFRDLLKRYDIYFFTGNPRVVSTVIFATLLLILGRRVVIWGQLHTAGSHPFLERLRLGWWRRFKYLLMYNDHEVQLLRASGFSLHTLLGINNGLDQNSILGEKSLWPAKRLHRWREHSNVDSKLVLLSCARMEKKNSFELMINALPIIRAKHPTVLWVLIGDGSERQALQWLAHEKGVSENILWLGSMHAEEELCPWFLTAAALIHPGAIGLSLLHAFGYGLPVVTHMDASGHMPEFSTMPASNYRYCFTPGDIEDLATKILALLAAPTECTQKISTDVLAATRHHNVEVMVSRFIEMTEKCLLGKNKVSNQLEQHLH